MRLEHGFRRCLLLSGDFRFLLQLLALGRDLTVAVNIKYLIETQAGQQFLAARSAMHDMKMPMTKFL